MTTVHTKRELEAAVKAGTREIQVRGELAKAIHERRETKKKVGIGAAILAVGGIAAAPFTGGASLVATGPSVATILAVSIGAGLLVAIHEGYEDIDFEITKDGARLQLRKKGAR
ncbi:MAG: hypothetical protein R3C29_17815 [Dehalococcoidia bacterium]